MTNDNLKSLGVALPKGRHALLLAAVVCLGAGCVAGDETSDDDAGTSDPVDAGTNPTARLTVGWSIKNVNGTAVQCGSNYNRVKLHAQAYSDVSEGKTGDPFTQLFDCSAGTGTLEVPISGDAETGGFEARDINGKYDVWITQTEASGQLERQTSQPAYQLDLTTGNKSTSLTLYENGGYHLVSWGQLADSTGDIVSCEAAGVDTVELVSLNEETQQTTTHRFPCTGAPHVFAAGFGVSGGGISSPLVAGRYTFTMNAYANNVKVGESQPVTEHEVENLTRINAVADHHFITISTR